MKERSIHILKILLRKDTIIQEVNEEEEKLLRNVDELLLKEERFITNREKELSSNDYIPFDFPKTKEEKKVRKKSKEKSKEEIGNIG
jgi:hypothetical protein